jgi:putative membrane protein
MMILVWLLIVVAIVVSVCWLMGQGKESQSESALEMLRRRYARGEISREEFESRKKDLS